MWTALLILIAAIVLFVTERIRVDVVALGVVVALMLTGILDTQEALSGFSNPAVLTIAALFVVGGAVMHTGLAGSIGRRVLRVSGTGEPQLLVAVMITVALLSAVMSDTGTVAVMLPAIISLGVSAGVRPSRLLMPLAFGALLGGATTLIGTPPNIIVSDLLGANGYEPFGFFSFTPVGIVLVALGIVYMLVVGRRLLPSGHEKAEPPRVASPQELVDLYRLPDNLFRVRVRRGSSVVGLTLGEARLRSDHRVTVLEIMRTGEPRPGLRFGKSTLRQPAAATEQVIPSAATVLELDDVLIVEGKADDVWHAAAALNLGVQPAEPADEEALIDEEAGIAEVVLPPRSSLLGSTLSEVRFASTYHVTVLSINRPGAHEEPDLDSARLQFGDVLLVQGPWTNILDLKEHRKDFVVMGQPEAMLGPASRAKAPIALAVLAGMVLLIVTGLISVAAASLLAALLMVLTGCLTMDKAYEAIDWRSVVLIAGMISMSVALQKVELVDMVAHGLTGSLGVYGPLAVMAGLFVLTSGFTQVLSNTATTVLIAPVALAAAGDLTVEPYAFLMTVAIAASMAFASPIASPVNTLVMGAGDYKFGDYTRVGLPLTLVMLVATLILVPLLFPF
jgi:di/tricarboxylate transporter